jgi:hypothetical protein
LFRLRDPINYRDRHAINFRDNDPIRAPPGRLKRGFDQFTVGRVQSAIVFIVDVGAEHAVVYVNSLQM